MDRKIPNFDFDFTPIGQAIKEARVAQKLTREQLAEESNYSDRHITSIENEADLRAMLKITTSSVLMRKKAFRSIDVL